MVDINGEEVEPNKVRCEYDDSDPKLPWAWFTIHLTDCPPFKGDNELGLTWVEQTRKGDVLPYMEELDITVQP